MENLTQDENQMMTLRDLLDRGFMALNTMIENATIYYGTTGSGKTTLTSYLFGKNVEANFNQYNILEVKIDGLGARQIGITRHPLILVKKCPDGSEKTIVDTTGYGNILGYPQEIADAFYNTRLLVITKKIKFVLVIAQSQITENNGLGFINAVDSFSAMFQNIELIQQGVAMCITKVNSAINTDFYKDQIRYITDNVNKLSEKSRRVLEFTREKFFFFNQPKEEGKLQNGDELFQQIEESLEFIVNTQDRRNNLFNISISERAQEPARNFFHQSEKIFQDSFQYVVDRIQDKCNEINDPNNVEQIVREVITYRKEIIKEDFLIFSFDREVIVEEKEIEISTKYKQVLDLDDMMSLRDFHEKCDEKEFSISTMQLCIESMFEVFEKNTRKQEQQQELKIKKKDILQNLQFVSFLKQVCGDAVTIQLDQIKAWLENTQESVKKAEQKGIDDIKVLNGFKSYQYYEKIYIFLNREPYKEERIHKDKMAQAQYFMGKIRFDEGKYDEKKYDDCAEHFKKAIILVKENESIDCQKFEEIKVDIYKEISEIYYKKEDSLRKFENQSIHQKLFDIYKTNFDENLEKFSKIIDQIGDQRNLLQQAKKLKYLEMINQIREQLSKLSTLRNIGAKQQIIENFEKLHQQIQQEFQMLDLTLIGEAETMDQSLVIIKNIRLNFEKNLNAQIFVNSLQGNEFQSRIEDWFSRLSQAYINIMQNQREVTRSIQIVDEDLDQIMKFASYLPNDRDSKEILSMALFRKGQIKQEEGFIQFKEAIKFFEQALAVNKDLFEAIECIADCNFEQKEYLEAMKFYKQINHNEKVLECFELQKNERGNTVELVKEKAKFYQKIGLYEKAKKILTVEAISIISKNIKRSQIEDYNNQIRDIKNLIEQISNPQEQVLFELQLQQQQTSSDEFKEQ